MLQLSCDIEVMAFKDIVKTVSKDDIIIALLEASVAFESVQFQSRIGSFNMYGLNRLQDLVESDRTELVW